MAAVPCKGSRIRVQASATFWSPLSVCTSSSSRCRAVSSAMIGLKQAISRSQAILVPTCCTPRRPTSPLLLSRIGNQLWNLEQEGNHLFVTYPYPLSTSSKQDNPTNWNEHYDCRNKKSNQKTFTLTQH